MDISKLFTDRSFQHRNVNGNPSLITQLTGIKKINGKDVTAQTTTSRDSIQLLIR